MDGKSSFLNPITRTVENGESESDNDDCILVDDANPREQLTSSGAYNEDELTQAIYLSTNRRAPGLRRKVSPTYALL